MIKIIVACDENNGIGFNGKLPWHYPEDLKHFKELTYGNTIIAGRKTLDNLPNGCLPNRLNLFLTNDVARWYPRTKNICGTEVLMMPPERKPWPETHGPWPVHSISYGIRVANLFPDFSKIIYIIGGQQIFNLALKKEKVNEVILTRIPGVHKADTYFPMDLIKNWHREDVKKEGLCLETYNKMDE